MNNRKVKLREVADIVKISFDSIFTILHEHLGMRKLFSKWGCRVCSRWNKNASMIQSAVWRCLHEIKRSLCDNGWHVDPPLHSGIKSVVSWVESSWWKPSKATKDATVGGKGYGRRILGCAWYNIYRLPCKRKNH